MSCSFRQERTVGNFDMVLSLYVITLFGSFIEYLAVLYEKGNHRLKRITVVTVGLIFKPLHQAFKYLALRHVLLIERLKALIYLILYFLETEWRCPFYLLKL